MNDRPPEPNEITLDRCQVGNEYSTPVDFSGRDSSIAADSDHNKSRNSSRQCKSSSRRLLARRASSMVESVCSSIGDFMMTDVDISKNYGHGTVPVRGKESHTADLKEFDRYIDKMRDADRTTEEELLKVGGVIGVNLEVDGSESDCEHEERDKISSKIYPPKFIDTKSENLSSYEDLDSSLNNIEERANLRFPFNVKFWTYVRSILENAKPVGFSELEDPNATLAKGPEDATAFISKVIGIKSINPIQPAILAVEGGFEEEEVLAELLYATCVGLVAMRFAPECVMCGSAVMDTDMLGRVPNRASCAGCNAPNLIDSLEKIKVMFLLNSDVLYILAENFACTPSAESMSHTKVFAAVPATSTGSGFSYSVGTGELTEIAPGLEPGKYRMHCPVAKTDNYLVVRRKSEENEEPVTLQMKVSDLVCNHHMKSEKTVLTVPHGRIQFDVLPDTKSFFVLWIHNDEEENKIFYLPKDERDLYTPASKVLHHPIFNALFQEQQVVAVPKDIFFSISNVVLVFTDIVDSTRLYTNLGDGEAFRLVRKHFQVLFAAFIKRGGRVVKTVGDAVMASFVTGKAALLAVADAMELLPTVGHRPDNHQYIEIRVGVHCGKATVVPLNGVNDYFGQTTNIAARVQSVAKASECFVTKTVLESDPDTWECYKEIVSPGSQFESTPETELNLKGLENKVQARGFRHVRRRHRHSDLSSSYSTYADRKEHTRISFKDLESNEFDVKNRANARRYDRPAETARRNSNFDSTAEMENDEK